MSDTGIVGAIPARYGSTRLHAKPLALIAGRTMIEHVYRRAAQAKSLARVVVLTDDERIADVVRGFGGEVLMTPESCQSGTDRIAYAARSWDAPAIVNIQGDEPLIDPAGVELLARHLLDNPDEQMATLAAPLREGDLDNPNVVKVVLDRRGYGLYFSRASIPYPRRPGEAPSWQHLGIYGYRRDVLLQLSGLETTPLERSESLEQLRALENGIPIRVLTLAEHAHPGVDTPEDLARVDAVLRAANEEGS
jgi:3-deoxy-manno-octulosonate cytidylyltransferase (CMP-KDO synthetase)